jgi:hypothetical protein
MELMVSRVWCPTCQLITKPPLIEAGTFSAEKIGTVEALLPMPTPNSRRVTKSCCQFWVNADPMTEKQQKMAEKKICIAVNAWRQE